jgi:hypothetical protein
MAPPTGHRAAPPTLNPEVQHQLSAREVLRGSMPGGSRSRTVALGPGRLGPPAYRRWSGTVPYFETLGLMVPSQLVEAIARRLPVLNIEAMAQVAMGWDALRHGATTPSADLSSMWMPEERWRSHMQQAGVPMRHLTAVIALTQELMQEGMRQELGYWQTMIEFEHIGEVFEADHRLRPEVLAGVRRMIPRIMTDPSGAWEPTPVEGAQDVAVITH